MSLFVPYSFYCSCYSSFDFPSFYSINSSAILSLLSPLLSAVSPLLPNPPSFPILCYSSYTSCFFSLPFSPPHLPFLPPSTLLLFLPTSYFFLLLFLHFLTLHSLLLPPFCSSSSASCFFSTFSPSIPSSFHPSANPPPPSLPSSHSHFTSSLR